MNKFQLLQYYYNQDFLKNDIENNVFPNVEVGDDYASLLETSAFLARTIGMGGCTSIEQFISMVDNTSPLTLEAFQFYISMQIGMSNATDKDLRDVGEPIEGTTFSDAVHAYFPEMSSETDHGLQSYQGYGTVHVESKTSENKSKVKSDQPAKTPPKVPPKERVTREKWLKNMGANTGSDAMIKGFLLSNNVSSKGIQEYEDKLSEGEIELPNYDFSKMSSAVLRNLPPEKFREYMNATMEYRNAGKNFKIGIGDFGHSKE